MVERGGHWGTSLIVRGWVGLPEFFSRALQSERLEQAIVERDSNLATTTSYVFQGGSSSGGRGGG